MASACNRATCAGQGAARGGAPLSTTPGG